MGNLGIYDELRMENGQGRHPKVVALGCKMVGGGSDGSLDICARVCLTDEYDNVIFHTYVKPQTAVTNYRLHEFFSPLHYFLHQIGSRNATL